MEDNVFYILDLPTNPGSSDLSRRKLWFDPYERVFHYQSSGECGSSSMTAEVGDSSTLRIMAEAFKGHVACPGLLSFNQAARLGDALIALSEVYREVISFDDDLPHETTAR